MSDAASSETTAVRSPAVRRTRPPLRVLGTSVTQIDPIKRAAVEDMGFALEFITLDGTEAQRQGALSPDSFDVYDQWFHDIDLTWPTASIQPIDIRRIDRWEEINDLPKVGRLSPDAFTGKGGDPSKRLYVQLDGTLGDTPTDAVSMVPTVHNADSFAVVGAPADEVTSWASLLDPDWSGRVVLQSDAAIGTLDMLLALRARNEMRVADIGDLSIAEIDQLIEVFARYRKRGHFSKFWADEAQAVAAMSSGQARIGSLWWSGLVKLRALGIKADMATPVEGYRGWFGGLAISTLLDPWAEDAVYDYLNWWLEGRPGALMARNGAYMANPESVRRHLSEAEWAFWYDGAPASAPILDPDGVAVFEVGERREGGSYLKRMSRIAVWDTVMNEHNYLVRRWENALSR